MDVCGSGFRPGGLHGGTGPGAGPWRGWWRGSGSWGAGGAYQRMYTPATVETVAGQVASIDKVTSMKGMSYGIHVILKTDKESIPVHLGPGWYVERLDTKLEKGDTVEVKGSRITINVTHSCSTD